MILWRISNYADLSGAGGLVHPGRWHSRGLAVVYLAESAAGALLEALVHIEASHPSELPKSYQLLEVFLPDSARILDVDLANSARTDNAWHNDLVTTRRSGDAWLSPGASLLLRVPSAVVGRTYNFLFNPGHPDAAQCEIVSIARYPYDPRLAGTAVTKLREPRRN